MFNNGNSGYSLADIAAATEDARTSAMERAKIYLLKAMSFTQKDKRIKPRTLVRG